MLSVRIISDAKGAQKGFDDTSTSADRMAQGMDRASVAAGAVLVGLGAMAMKLEAAGEAAATSNARITNITSSMGLMGDRAGVVSQRVIKSAEDMARKTGIDPNIIKQGQATLMTFENIAASADQVGGTFDRAAKSSTDLAAAGFGSVESAATMLGKALNDPVAGMAAMTRVGVTFSDSQKDTIRALQESGDMLGAQQEILAAVERQVGGTAEATANASDKMSVSWQLAEEELGQKLLPAFEKFRDLGMGAAGWIADNADLVLVLAGGLGVLASGVLAVNGAMKLYAAMQVIQTAAQWAQNAAWLANPVTWVVLAIVAAIALVVAIVWVWIENWEVLTGTVSDGANLIGDATGNVFGWIGDGWGNLMDGMTSGVEFIIGKIEQLMSWIEQLGRMAGLGFIWDALPDWNMRGYPAVADATGYGYSTPDYRTPTAPTLPRLNNTGAGQTGDTHITYQVTIAGTVIDAPGAARAVEKLLDDAAKASGKTASAGRRFLP
ncbi:MAG TPA: hypothetical protein VNJ04_11745 [Gemmatimonadaceae bacterium]|nr:hypothetical protein [Gemmatimonadaceae bacterium]